MRADIQGVFNGGCTEGCIRMFLPLSWCIGEGDTRNTHKAAPDPKDFTSGLPSR